MSVVACTDRLTVLVAELAACAMTDLVEPDASQVHTALRRAQDALAVVAARVLERVQADGRWATTAKGLGARDFEDYLTQQTGTSRAGARRQTRLAAAVTGETVPGLAEALTTGGVSAEHADVLARLAPTTPARRAALTSEDPRSNAAFLLRKAGEQAVAEFTKEVRRWAARVDPAADERGYREATAKVTCTLTPKDDVVALSAVLTPVDGAAFGAALTAVAGVPSIADTRTHAQRMGAALGDLARLVLDHGLAADRTGGFRPHLTVTVSLETMIAQLNALQGARTEASGSAVGPAGSPPSGGGQGGRGRGQGGRGQGGRDQGGRGRGGGGPAGSGQHGNGPARSGTDDRGEAPLIPPGWDAAVLADGTPIPASILARLACDSEVTRVVFGPASQVLDAGRTERLYSGPLRRAVIARDRHCAYPQCDRPPSMGEIHHVKHWAAHGGSTSVDNGVLLCWHHHDVVHTRHLTIHRNHARARWDFHERDGTPIPHPDHPPGKGSPGGCDLDKPQNEPDRPPDLFEVG